MPGSGKDSTLTPIDLSVRETVLKQTILDAGALALRHFRSRSAGEFTLKGQQDFLTEADTLVEAQIRRAIAAQFPDDAILGEESGGELHGDALWVIDPIDGTANFARGIEHFCVAIAFVYQGITELGAIYNPASEELYLTRRAAYVTKNDQPLSTSVINDARQASFELGWSNRVAQSRYLEVMTNLLDSGANIRRGASGALALAWVAEGRTDGYIELHMNAWDCLAGLLMVREAGGQTGTFPAHAGDIAKGGPVLAAAPGVAGVLSQCSAITLNTLLFSGVNTLSDASHSSPACSGTNSESAC